MQVYCAPGHETRWFEFAFQAMWPFVTKGAERFLMNDLAASIRESCADIPMLDKFRFTHCSLGDKLPTIGTIKSMSGGDYTGFLFNLVWEAADSNIEVEVGGRFKAGLKDLRLEGALLLGFSPLLECFPITGGMSISFSDPPELTWKWTGIGKVFDFRGVKKAIVQAVFNAIVVPNRIFSDIATSSGLVPEAEKPRMVDYMTPCPIGVLRLEVLAARDLSARDLLGTSDPYVVLRIGGGEYTTKTISQTLNPVWGEFQGQDYLVYDLEQKVFIELWDEDRISQDEALGYVVVEPQDGGKLRRPIVAEMAEAPQAWWALDLAGTGFEGKHRSEILIRAHFATPSQRVPHIRPNHVDCPLKCGLQLTQSGGSVGSALGMKRCQLCNKSLSQSWKSWLSSKSAPMAKVCAKCNYGVCMTCSVHRRPASGLLRIILKSARVPVDDASKGAVIAFSFEGTQLRSAPSKLPVADASLESLQKAQVANNLRWHAGLDEATIGRCLDMSLDEVNFSLGDRKLKTHATTKLELRASDYDESRNTQTVVWDQAFHFLVKDPLPDETDEQCSVSLTYSVSEGMFPKKTNRKLSGTHPLYSELVSRKSSKASGASHHDSQHSASHHELLMTLHESVSWAVTSEAGDAIELELDISLEPLMVQEHH